MKTKLTQNERQRAWHKAYALLRLVFLFVALSVVGIAAAQEKKPKSQAARSVSSSVPSGYSQVGNTLLYYNQSSYSIDIMGKFGSSYYGSTYSNNGYRVAMKVDSLSAIDVDCLYGTTDNGVSFSASVEQQGELARICYTVTNANENDVTVSLGTHADVMIGDNDRAPISKRTDTIGNTYGLTMKDGNGAQLCVLFGAGLAGVTSVSDFWFGHYSLNNYTDAMVGNYSSGNNYMEENGSYDSGMGWCWKDRVIPAGGTQVFSYLIGVGDVNLEPSSTFEVTPDDPEGWNDLSRPHRLTLEGEYESPAGLEGRIEYAVEDETEWHALTEMLNSGDTFTASLVANFDASKQKHVIRFRTVDNVGNATLLPSIEYLDVSYYPVSGIQDKTYTGDSLYQTELLCDIDEDQYVTSRYSNNVNAGIATFYAEGLFPYTIGRKAYTFNILPQPLSGDLTLQESEYVYSGEAITPEWTFTESLYANLERDKDYQVTYENNLTPGTGSVKVEGIGNYTGTLCQTFFIDKAPLTDELYSVTLPDSDVCYDGQSHAATISKQDGVGEATISYNVQGEENDTTDAPSAPGNYDIYLEIADGTLYYGVGKTKIGSFAIYQFDGNEWTILETIKEQLTAKGWAEPWDLSQGAKSASTLEGLKIAQGHVVGLNLADSNLAGELPWSVFGLPYLEELNLSGNNLSGDIGQGMLETIAENPNLAVKLKTVNISNNKFSGNISLFANNCPVLQNLDASFNCIADVMPAISSTVTTLDLSHQTIDRIIDLDLVNLNPEAWLSTVPTVLTYDHQAQSYKDNLNLLCTTAELSDFDMNSTDNWGVILNYADGQLPMLYSLSEQNAYYGESGDILNVALLNDDYTQEGTTFKMRLSFASGDANFSGGVDVTDLQTIILRIFDKYNDLPFNHTAANTVKDDVLNVQDVVGEVNILLSNNSDKAQAARIVKPKVVNATSEAAVYCNNNELKINTTIPVAAFDIIVDNASSLSVSDHLSVLGITCATRETSQGTHIIGYSLTGGTIPVGDTTIASFKGIGHSVSSAVLADVQASNISVAMNAETTSVGNILTNPLDATFINGKLVVSTDSAVRDIEWIATALDGHLLGKGTVSGHSGTSTIDLDVDGNGVIIITLKSNDMKLTKKLINNR